MFIETLLNGTWDLRDEILSLELSHAPRLSHLADGWMPMPVPGDIHQGLIATGRIKEPLLGLNSFDCHWTEFRSWWLRKTFDAPSDWLDMDVIELELNGLDSNAELFLNGVHVGSHRSAFYPFVRDVKPWLVAGQNVLLVRLTAGVEDVADVEVEAPDGVRPPGEADRGRMERGDARRLVVRKPQYSFGWDWSPRLATTAIAGDVKLRAMRHACIRHVNLVPHQEPDGGVTVAATVTVDQFHYYKSSEGVVSLALTDAQGRRHEASARAVLRSGYTFVELKIPLPDPQLWWPNGMGAQHLYRVEAELAVGEQQMAFAPFDWGLRFLDLDTDGLFAVVVNGKHVFCKGGDWIPADALYARTDDARYETLVREARDANFTMLRIWGGGWYERDAFYQACDRHGILIWHDFMFACAPYPDHLESFRALVEREADYQTKRLQRHACIALWCGSNENNWGFRDWWSDRTQRGAHLYNYLLPSVVQRNCPEVPYWNGSPYGGDAPNSSEVGDQHYWHEAMMSPKMERRITP
ncbi:MAG: beta-mannosidase, partial [Anaerolineae bacterium]|nr:beta-mannosidase [Anaerolineae bacterium]